MENSFYTKLPTAMQNYANRRNKIILQEICTRYGGNEVVTELLRSLALCWLFIDSVP